MHELDLIPESYRQRLKIQRWLNIFFSSFIVVLIVIAGLHVAITNKLVDLKSKVQLLQKDKQLTLQQQQQFKLLQEQEKSLAARLKMINSLRGGPPAKQIFLAIDRVINPNIWFTKWQFFRANTVVPVTPETVPTGYFIVIPDQLNPGPQQQAWKMETHMEIAGQALSYSILANFVKNLVKQPEIEDVKLIKTNLGNFLDSQVVEFKMAVLVNNQ